MSSSLTVACAGLSFRPGGTTGSVIRRATSCFDQATQADRQDDHVGLVEAVHSNGTITTLEGNTSDIFARRVRSSCIVGYGRPAYGDAAPMPGTDGMLRLGSSGNGVRKLQTNLNTVMKSGLVVDGQFGPRTETAVKAFQARYKLTVDGVYGPSWPR
jgi:hypothetical protein